MQLLEGPNFFPVCLNNKQCFLMEFSVFPLNLLLLTVEIFQCLYDTARNVAFNHSA